MDFREHLPIIIPGLTALVGAVIGSLIAPWVNWGVEKRRARLAERSKLIGDLRSRLHGPFDKDNFRDSPAYSAIRPFLSREVRDSIDSIGVQITRTIEIGAGDKMKRQLLNDLSRIERKWDLI